MLRRPATLLCSLALAACGAPNLSRTVGPGNAEIHSSLGGPFFTTLGPPIPVPHVNVGGRVGVAERLDIDANTDLLAWVFGVFALDIAAVAQIYRKAGGLAIAGTGRLFMYGDLDDRPAFRAYPELGLHLGGPVPKVKWLALYGGTTMVGQLDPPLEGSAVFLTPFFGTEFLFPVRQLRNAARKPRQHGLALHTSWTNPWDSRDTVLGYRPGPGAIALYLGYRVRFGGLDR